MGRTRMAALGLSVLLTGPALAGEAFEDGVVHFAPVSPVRGGDSTKVHVLVLDADGNPRLGLGATPIGGGGRATGWTESGAGWYAFDFMADRDVSSGSVRLRGAVSGRVPITILPRTPARLKLTSEPASVVVGSGIGSTVSIAMAGFPGKIDLRARTSSGTMGAVVRAGDSNWTVTLTPPSQNFPHLGLITVSAPGGVAVGGGAVAFRGAVAFPVAGPPGASVSLTVGERTFGPVTLDTAGKGKLAIEVPPGVREATQLTEQGANRSEGQINLAPPDTRRLAWVPAPGPIPQGQSATLHVLALEANGEPDVDANLQVVASSGILGRAAHIGNGLYAMDYRAGMSEGGSLTVSIPGSPIDVDQLEVVHLSPMPGTGMPPTSGGAVAAVLLLPVDTSVVMGGSRTIRVVAVDRYGYPVPGVDLVVSSTIGKTPTTVNTGGKGVAEFAWVATESGSASVRAEATNGVAGTTSLLVSSTLLEVSMPSWTGLLEDWRGRLKVPDPVEPDPEPVEPDPEPVEPDPEPVEPDPTQRPSARFPWLRARLGGVFGLYSYTQFPNEDSGPLVGGQFSIGGAGGGKPASIQGGEIDVRAWVHPNVGVHLTGRTVQYGFTADLFDAKITDWVTHAEGDVTGRLPVKINGGSLRYPLQVWAGGHLGVQADDFMLFEGCLQSGCRVDYKTVFVTGLEFGVDVGVDYGPFFSVGSLSQGYAGGRVPYRFSFDIEAGYEVTDSIFVGLGGGGVLRQIGIEGSGSGIEYGGIVDRQWYSRLFVGFQY